MNSANIFSDEAARYRLGFTADTEKHGKGSIQDS